MRLKVDLTPDLEDRLAREARLRGIPVEILTVDLLNRYLPETGSDRAAKVVSLLDSWLAADTEEQRETGAYLIRALDDDRLSERELFPDELEGKTW